jgi:hypothetical protein
METPAATALKPGSKCRQMACLSSSSAPPTPITTTTFALLLYMSRSLPHLRLLGNACSGPALTMQIGLLVANRGKLHASMRQVLRPNHTITTTFGCCCTCPTLSPRLLGNACSGHQWSAAGRPSQVSLRHTSTSREHPPEGAAVWHLC